MTDKNKPEIEDILPIGPPSWINECVTMVTGHFTCRTSVYDCSFESLGIFNWDNCLCTASLIETQPTDITST